MQHQQGRLDRGDRIGHLGGQRQVAGHRLGQLLDGEGHHRLARAVGGPAGSEQTVEHQGGNRFLPAQAILQALPCSRQLQTVPPACHRGETQARAALTVGVGQRFQQPQNHFGLAFGTAPVTQPLGGRRQRQAQLVPIRRLLPQRRQQGAGSTGKLGQDTARGVDARRPHLCGQHGPALDQAVTGHRGEDRQHLGGRLLRRAGGVGRQGIESGQRVDGQRVLFAGIGGDRHQRAEDGHPLRHRGRGQTQTPDGGARLLQRQRLGPRGDDGGPVLGSDDQPGALQPGQRRLHLGVGVRIVGREAEVEFRIGHQLARGGHHLVLAQPLRQSPHAPQDLADVAPPQLRPGGEAKLLLQIVGIEQQHAGRRQPVPPGASGLLRVRFQGAGHIGVHHQPHAVLVDAHPEGVGGAYHRDGAADEARQDLRLVGGLHAGMEGGGRPAVSGQRVPQLLGAAPGGGVDHGAGRRSALPDMLLQQGSDALDLLRRRDALDGEGQVGALGAPGVQVEFLPQPVTDVAADLLDDLVLGGGGQAGDGWRRRALAFGQFGDEACGVEIVGAEVMAPLGQAVRLVEHPGADLPLLDGADDRRVAQLFGGHIEEGDVALAHPVHHRRSGRVSAP